MSTTPLESPGTRFDASDAKTAYRPLALSLGSNVTPFACSPALETLTRLVVAVAAEAGTPDTATTRPTNTTTGKCIGVPPHQTRQSEYSNPAGWHASTFGYS